MSLPRRTRLGLTAAGCALALAAAAAPAPGAPAPGAPAPGAPGAGGPPPHPGRAAAAPAAPRFDLDRDGRGDLVATGYDTLTQVFTSGRGYAPAPYALDAADLAEVFKDLIPAGDLDGDRRPELLTLSADGRLTLHTAAATGTGPARWTGRGWQIYNRVVAAGDLTRDGRPDLLAREPGGDLYLYRGTGRTAGGPFAPRAKVGHGWGGYDQITAPGDADGDGTGDLLARSLDGTLWFYRGTGDAAAPLRARVAAGTGWNRYPLLVGADDLDGDGLGDLLGRAPDGTLQRHSALGDGTFGPAVRHGDGWQHRRLTAGGGAPPVYGKGQTVGITADWRWLRHDTRADGRYGPPWDISDPADPTLPAGMKTGYAAALHLRNHATFLQVQGTALYLNGRLASSSWSYGLTAGPGDLSGDGRGDLLARDSAGTLWLHPGNGAFHTALGARVKIGGGWQVYDVLAGSGDLTNDGRADLLARDRTGRLYLYAGTGTAATPFRPRVLIGAGWNTYDALVAPGDLDGDGKADLVARDARGDLYRYSATGRGGTATLAPRVRIGTGWQRFATLF
ncbi:VCBS repeat-containing protein [Streptomyces bambusae]|uniref:FG-GAP repeat domain-containing protein n=1 Tax=Streptomyces bambusae TaxID=1550616 RepID=UPI001CFDB5D2|nr:VCBS repeat-containing protein [Streptomyces bambusae]MCB5166760.1 VCBS repeat-containing protein [Streptomyces bambusae]